MHFVAEVQHIGYYFRFQNRTVLRSSLSEIRSLRRQFPNLVAGFDVANHEDKGHDLIYFIEELLEPSQEEEHLPYVLHAGETGLLIYKAIMGSDNGLSPGRHQAIIKINIAIWSNGSLGSNFSEIWIVE